MFHGCLHSTARRERRERKTGSAQEKERNEYRRMLRDADEAVDD